ncbi:MAG: type VI secretion system lipoprotein TssJ [Proteobacteria bacterium]|nr:MAG: type VI secretion system lipoprotein TssJ [Pseudomonadota bacterium]
MASTKSDNVILSNNPAFPMIARTGLYAAIVALSVSGCGGPAAVQAVGAAVNIAMQLSGIKAEPNAGAREPTAVALHISAGQALNTTASGEPLSLVLRIYQLRNDRAFGDMPYSVASADDAGRALLKEDLIAVRDLVLIPGKRYDLPLTLPEGGTVIGVVGLFHSPANGRWKLSFDAEASSQEGITIGAHACALTAGRGALSNATPIETSRTLAGVQCNT